MRALSNRLYNSIAKMETASFPFLILSLALLSSSTYLCHGQGITECPQHDGSCLDCLRDPFCGSWYDGAGCFGSCVIADIHCYSKGPSITNPETAEEVCARADKARADAAICSAATDCGTCTATPLSDGNGNCAWFSRIAGREFCGKPGCGRTGCGDTDPNKCPAPPKEENSGAAENSGSTGDDEFKLLSLDEDSSLCVGIAGGTPIPGKILKLADCDESNGNMRWKMDGKRRFKTKVQYDDEPLCWHPKAITEGSSIKLTNCKDKRKQRFRFSGTAAPIASRDPDLCVLYSNGPPSKGDKVKLQNCTGDASQNWSWA